MVKYPQDFFLSHVQTRSSSPCGFCQHDLQQDCKRSHPILVQGLNGCVKPFSSSSLVTVEVCWFIDIRE